MPAKEQVICVDIYRLAKLISCSTSGEVSKCPRFPREFWGKNGGGKTSVSKILIDLLFMGIQ
jgi:hypothetical protein